MPKRKEKQRKKGIHPGNAVAAERRKRVIEYYETVANQDTKETVRHFRSEVIASSIHRIIRTHEKRKKDGYWKRKHFGGKRTVQTAENLRKLEELYRVDPNIVSAEACQILNLKGRSSLYRLKLLYQKVKSGSTSALNDEVIIDYPNAWSSKDKDGKRTTSSGAVNDNDDNYSEMDHQEFSISSGEDEKKVFVDTNQKRKKLKSKKIKMKLQQNTQRCLACFESFETRNETDTSSKLQDNVNMVFVFKTLLGLSSEELVSIMKISKGANPKDWAHFCEKCSVLVKEAAAIPRKIRELEERLTECRKQITENIKNSWTVKSRSICVRENLYVTRKVRDIVKKQKTSKSPCYKLNSFEDGDKQVESLLPPLAQSKVMVKQEVETRDEAELNSFSDMEESVDISDVFRARESEMKYSVLTESPCMESENKSPLPVDSFKIDPCVPFDSQKETTSDTTSAPTTFEKDGSALDPTPLPISTQGICDTCGMEMRPLAIPSHKLNVHGIVMEGFTVKYCTKQGCDFKTLYNIHLKNHMKKHELELTRPHCCSWCSMRFLKRKQLEQHEEIHKNADSRPYVCDLCGSSFAVKNYLYLHKRLSHEKRYFPSTKRKRSNQKQANASSVSIGEETRVLSN